MEKSSESNLSRRKFLRGAGTAVAATALARSAMAAGPSTHESSGQATPHAAPVSKAVPPGSAYDVIVIGGGFAGLTAARDCALRGMKTLLLEARARVGGRTFTSSFADHPLELGGTWIHWSQPFVWDEVTRYGLSLAESPGSSPDAMSWLSQGKIHKGDAMKVFPTLADAMAKYCDVDGQGGRLVMPRAHDPFFNADALRKYDGMSLQDRLVAMRFKPDIRDLVAPQLSINCHRDPATGAFVDQLKWWSLGDFDMGRLFDKLGRYKIKEGTAALANAIASDGNVDIMLSTAVGSVEQARGGALVTTVSGAAYSAKAVVCAVPVNVLKSIKFNPGLNSHKLDASRAGVQGQGTKCYIHIKQKIGKWMGCGSYPNPITLVWTEQERDDGTLLVCFGPPGKLDINDEESVQAALRQILPGANVIATTGYQWTADPFSQGTWCFYQPGQVTTALQPLRQREGNVFFASADSALGWRGFIDGAIESGTATAHEVSQFLRG